MFQRTAVFPSSGQRVNSIPPLRMIIVYCGHRTYLLTYLLTSIKFSHGASSPYNRADKTNKTKYKNKII